MCHCTLTLQFHGFLQVTGDIAHASDTQFLKCQCGALDSSKFSLLFTCDSKASPLFKLEPTQKKRRLAGVDDD